jgi:hypothetical protein
MMGSHGLRRLGSTIAVLLAALTWPSAARGDLERADEPAAEKHGFGVAPLAGATYSGETSVMFGAAAILFYKHPEAERRRESKVLLATAYSLREQFTILADGSLYLVDDLVRIAGRVQFSVFPDSYFGIGNDTLLADEERYTPVTERVELSPQYQLIEGLYLGPALAIEHQNIVEVVAQGHLATDPIPGRTGGTSVGIGIDVVHDTRDSTLYPHRGFLLELRSLVFDPLWGSDFRRSLTRVDLRGYFSMPPRDHVLAIRSLAELGTGTHPFWGLPRLGGESLLRGQFAGRYRDRQAVALQTEYRLPVVWRLGMVGFAELGEVAPEVGELTVKDVRYSVGGGLRVNLSNKAPMNLRIDVGGGRDDWDLYVNVGEAF